MRKKAVVAVKKSFIYISTLVLVAGYPTSVMATSQEPVAESEVSATAEQEPEEIPLTYTYDPTTEKWNSEEWQYNQESESYERPPEPVIVTPEVSDAVTEEIPNSNEPVTEEAEQSSEKTIDTNVGVDNQVTSDAISGDALISGNTNAGSAISGDATAVANIINAVNSSIGADNNQKIATFSKDIMGDVKGDIVLYPLLLKAMLEQQAGDVGGTEINATTNFDVSNDVNLNAQTGDATVENNTKAGNATSGNATAMANVINILNSMIAMQDSFIGTINIYGSLEGDILIAPDFIPQMLANNSDGSGETSTKLSTQDTTTIVNNISAVAESGAASVFGNTNGGSATTGDAESSVVIFNITGRDIIAENSMLVFVNVLGRWVGMIVDAPAGATAAMIGNGVMSNEKYAPDLTLESESSHGITNTIAIHAGSGDATVKNNTTGGNATSGSAHALANVANVSNSSISLAGWFGLLFINITGDWFGSFQIDTEYGNTPGSSEVPKPNPNGPVEFVSEESKPSVQTVNSAINRVIIDSRNLGSVEPAVLASTNEIQPETEAVESEVMGTSTDNPSTQLSNEEDGANNVLFFIVAGSIIIAGTSVVAVRRIF